MEDISHEIITVRENSGWTESSVFPHLLFSDVYRLIEDDPGDSLVASRHSGGAVVRHVVLCVREEPHDTQSLHFYLFSWNMALVMYSYRYRVLIMIF